MPLAQVVFLAALQGLAEALPLSGSGHAAIARLWVDGALDLPAGPVLGAVLQLGVALGLAMAARQRLAAVLRAFAHPESFGRSPDARDAAVLTVGCGVSLTVSLLVLPRVELWGEPPLATALGLLVTGLGLASTLAARPLPDVAAPARPPLPAAPSLLTAALVGLVHGLAVLPGASRVGAALIVLLWLGVRPARAVDLAFLLTVPSLALRAVQGLVRGAPGPALDTGTLATGLLFAFLATVLAAALLHALADRRRVGALALWMIPLGLSLLAYARALPLAGA